jgi:hypothetical protein
MPPAAGASAAVLLMHAWTSTVHSIVALGSVPQGALAKCIGWAACWLVADSGCGVTQTLEQCRDLSQGSGSQAACVKFGQWFIEGTAVRGGEGIPCDPTRAARVFSHACQQVRRKLRHLNPARCCQWPMTGISSIDCFASGVWRGVHLARWATHAGSWDRPGQAPRWPVTAQRLRAAGWYCLQDARRFLCDWRPGAQGASPGHGAGIQSFPIRLPHGNTPEWRGLLARGTNAADWRGLRSEPGKTIFVASCNVSSCRGAAVSGSYALHPAP